MKTLLTLVIALNIATAAIACENTRDDDRAAKSVSSETVKETTRDASEASDR